MVREKTAASPHRFSVRLEIGKDVDTYGFHFIADPEPDLLWVVAARQRFTVTINPITFGALLLPWVSTQVWPFYIVGWSR